MNAWTASAEWYDGDNYDSTVEQFGQIIEDVHEGKYEFISEALNNAAGIVADEYFK